MPTYFYKGVSAGGQVVQGEMDAVDRGAVVRRLREQGLLPIRAEERRGVFRAFEAPGGKTLTSADLTVFTRSLATLLQAGLPVDRALHLLDTTGGGSRTAHLAAELCKSLRGGVTLASAMEAQQRVFPKVYIGLVRAGEAGATLPTTLSDLAALLDRRRALERQVRSAMQYPILVLATAALSILILMVAVVPEFRPLFEDNGMELPASTRLVLGMSDLIRFQWPWLLLALLLSGLGLWSLSRQPGTSRALNILALRLPLIRAIVIRAEVSRFARTLGVLLRNGVSLLPALTITTEVVGNSVMADALARLIPQLKTGNSLASSLEGTGLFPPLAVQLVRVGEESGRLEAMLLEVAGIHEEQLAEALGRALALLLPTLTILLGAMVAVVVGSILTAILSSYNVAI